MNLTNNNWKKQASAVLADKEAEIAFMKIAMRAIEEKAAPILKAPYFLGFEVVYSNMSKDRMIGIFGCRLGKQLLYIPVFYINGALKNTDLLYLQSEKQFVLLNNEWCDYLIGKYVISQGKSVNSQEVSNATQELDLRWLAFPPMLKMAEAKLPLGHTFGFYEGDISEEDSKKSFDEFFKKEANAEDKKHLKKFIKKEGFKAFQKIASAVYNDYEFANNMIKLLDEDDWLIPEFLDEKGNIKKQAEETVSVSKTEKDPILEAKNCILVHKGKFNPYAKFAEEQIEKAITIEDRRDPNKFDVIYEENKNQYQTFDNFNPGYYNVLGADGTTKDFVVFTGKSDDNKQVALMIEPDTKKILHADNVSKDSDTESSFHDYPVDLSEMWDIMLAKPIDEKKWEDFTVNSPEVGKVYALYSHYNNYVSDECFMILKHTKEDDVDIYSVLPFYRYSYLDSVKNENLGKSFTIRVNPSAIRSNIGQRIFRKDELVWIPIAIKETKSDIDEESENVTGNMSISRRDYTVETSDFIPASIYDYEMGLESKGLSKSEIEKVFDNKYVINISGSFEHSEPLNKIASTVKLMHDLNISQDDASELLDRADENNNVKFYHKKIATRMLLKPEPSFYESLDADLGINVFENDTKVVPIDATSDYSPDPRYGDKIYLADVENKAVESKPQEFPNSKNSDVEVDERNDILLTATPNMLAQIAEKTGNKNIFDHGIIGTYAKTSNASMYITEFIPDLRQSLDKLGRLLFLYYWKPADFSVYYGSDDLMELEASLSSAFKQMGELILDLSLRTKKESINNASINVD